MRKISIITACLVALGWRVQAQEHQREVTRYQWDVATELLWLVDKNHTPPSILVRLNQVRDGKRYAYRFRIGGNYARNFSPSPIDTAGGGPVPLPTYAIDLTMQGGRWLGMAAAVLPGSVFLRGRPSGTILPTARPTNGFSPGQWPV